MDRKASCFFSNPSIPHKQKKMVFWGGVCGEFQKGVVHGKINIILICFLFCVGFVFESFQRVLS
jgi:hypothetical protein